MKSLYIILSFFLFVHISYTQDVENLEIPLSNPGQPGYLHLGNHNGTITVSGYSGNTVKVSIVSKSDGDEKKKSKNKYGLKKIAKQGSDVSITEDGNEVEISGSRSSNQRIDFDIQVPRNFSLNLSTHHNGDVKISDISGVLEINAHHGAIEAKDVSGAVVADTHHGSIVVTFKDISNDDPMAFSTYHGNVDVSFPTSIRANLKMKSAKGDIYTDFEFEPIKPEAEQSNHEGKKEIKLSGWTFGELGGGGEEYMFNTYHGDVIIRQN